MGDAAKCSCNTREHMVLGGGKKPQVTMVDTHEKKEYAEKNW